MTVHDRETCRRLAKTSDRVVFKARSVSGGYWMRVFAKKLGK